MISLLCQLSPAGEEIAVWPKTVDQLSKSVALFSWLNDVSFFTVNNFIFHMGTAFQTEICVTNTLTEQYISSLKVLGLFVCMYFIPYTKNILHCFTRHFLQNQLFKIIQFRYF